ncbi:MAG: AMP-dependent synthetase/ligase [Bacteroidales bacterium]
MEVKRTFDIVDHMIENSAREDALVVKRMGQWEKFTTAAYKESVDNFSFGLLELGFERGEKIATVSNNRPEWNFMDMGMSQVGGIHVPIYPNISNEEYAHILEHSEARFVVLSSIEHYEKIKPIADKIKRIEKVYVIDNIEGLPNISEIIALGVSNKDKHKDKLTNLKQSIKPDDLCSIIYTSGTTGLSKGVMLSHNNFISNLHACKHLLPLDPQDRILSFLPLCHVLERMVNYLFQFCGYGIYYAESIDTIGDNIKEVKPHGFVAVPRVIEKLYDKIILKGKELKGIKRILFFWAVNVGLRYELNNANGFFYEIKRKIASKLIFSKWRAALGGNVKIIVSGGASLQPRLARIFYAAGLIIQEGYGLTETSPVIAVNHRHYPNIKFGTVGPVIDGVQVKIAEDGEILMKGPNLMQGYFKDPVKTSEVIDADGWFHTGDIGVLHEGNILQITDRKKEIFKLSTGKYLAPQVIENKFKESPFIEQIMVVGENEKYAAAIICPSFEYLHDWCSLHNIRYRDNKDLIQNPKVIERIQREVDIFNEQLGRHEQIKKFELTCQEWLPTTGELSPTLKLKRKFLAEKYKIKLSRLYGYTNEEGHVGIPSN